MPDLTIRDPAGVVVETIDVDNDLIRRFANALGAAIHRAAKGGGETPTDPAVLREEGLALGLSGPGAPER